MVRLTPGDPALIMVGGRHTTAETLQNIRTKYGLDRDPIINILCGWETFSAEIGVKAIV
jgi:ABC-type dipeptide/oligopeptide/nickel transport system permease component